MRLVCCIHDFVSMRKDLSGRTTRKGSARDGHVDVRMSAKIRDKKDATVKCIFQCFCSNYVSAKRNLLEGDLKAYIPLYKILS